MSAHTRIRPAGGLLARLWRALRICPWARTAALASLSGGDVESQVVQARKCLCALSHAGIVYRRQTGRGANWRLVRDLGPQAPTYRRRASVLYTTTRGRSFPM